MSSYADRNLTRLSNAVTALQNDPSNSEKLFELVMCGHLCFKGGMGLPIDMVKDTIEKTVENLKEDKE